MNLDKKILGRQIRQHRIESNISQEKLSEMIDISPRQMCTIENGNSFPSIDTFLKIAKVLNIDLNEFFNLKDYNSNTLRNEVINLVRISNEKDLYLIKDIIKAIHSNRN